MSHTIESLQHVIDCDVFVSDHMGKPYKIRISKKYAHLLVNRGMAVVVSTDAGYLTGIQTIGPGIVKRLREFHYD